MKCGRINKVWKMFKKIHMVVRVLIPDPDSIHKTIETIGIKYLAKKINNKRNKTMKDKIEKKINSMINTNDLTDMQVWGIMCCIGFISACIIMWII